MAPLPPVNRGAKAPQRGAPTTNERLARKGFQDLKNTSELKDFIEQNHPRLMAERDEIDEIAERNRLGRDPAVRIGRMPEMPVSAPGQLPPGFDDVLPPNFTQRTIVRPPVKEIDRTADTEVEADDIEDNWKDAEARQIIKTLNIANLPVEHQKRIVAGQKKKNVTEQADPSEPVKRKVISNVPTQDKNTPVNAPQPSYAQIKKQVEAEVRAELKAPPKEEPKSAPRFVIRSIPDPDVEDYESIPLVSDFVFYDFDRLDIRKFNLKDAVPLSNAKRERNIPDFLNAVGKTLLNADIRDLTMPDLRYVLYWHQFNSFTRTPMNIRWQSKYGNENYYKISERDLNYVKPPLTREQYRSEWLPLGLTYSTVRDWEFMENNEITAEEIFIVERAQWFKGDPSDSSFQSKIDAMTLFCGKSLDSINALPEFIEAAKHRVEEWINVTDIQFDPNKYLKVLEKQQEILQARREELGDEDLFEIESLNDDIVVIETQINDINETLEKKEAVEPDLERISLNVGILDFFPGL